MLTREDDALLQRYVDGELDAAATLKVEDRLRRSPAARAHLAELQVLDARLRRALGQLPAPGAGIEERIVARMKRAPAAPPPFRDLERYRRATLGLRIAAALLFAAIAIQIAFLLRSRPEPREDPGRIARLRETVDRLERENQLLRAQPGQDRRSPGTLRAIDPRPSAVAEAPEPGPAATPELPRADKDATFRSVRALLDEFRRTGRWDRSLQAAILAELDRLDDLGEEDFRQFCHLYAQQDPHTMGQLFVAEILSRYFTHELEGRAFIYAQAEQHLEALKSNPEPWMGDRVLRRAWTEGLMHRWDTRSVDLLYELGRYERDWVNRKNIYGGLANIGTADAALRLAQLAAAETNPILKQDALTHLYDIIYSDPSLRSALDGSVFDLLRGVVLGDVGANGANFDSMLWALQILAHLGYPIEELRREWERNNAQQPGSDPRATNPRGVALDQPKSPK
ncbi:MAG: hypothetical protein JXQ29_08155 [Planctomycetes bacterium]|nr:hypothetical protein [Planctomycetota bacterium]